MIRVKCPCCGNYTQLAYSENDPIFEFCEVCFWQYDAVAHDKPDMVIGANHMSLNDARKNYEKFGVCKPKYKDIARSPLPEELPENNREPGSIPEVSPDDKNLKLTIDLLPRGAWDKNLSRTLPQCEWDELRRAAYERSGYKCAICGDSGGQLEAHEVWEFNIPKKTQKLTDITAICKSCHMVKHLRHTKLIGGEEYAKKHFMRVNGCDEQTFTEHYKKAEARFDELSRVDNWTLDTSALSKLGRK